MGLSLLFLLLYFSQGLGLGMMMKGENRSAFKRPACLYIRDLLGHPSNNLCILFFALVTAA